MPISPNSQFPIIIITIIVITTSFRRAPKSLCPVLPLLLLPLRS